MEKNTGNILIGILIGAQIVSFLTINNMKRQIQNTYDEMNDLSEEITNDINDVYTQVDEMLKQKASLIESASTEIGVVNKEKLSVPITFTLTPKEVSDATTVSLDFNGELYPMEKNGITFTATVSQSIFDNAVPKIIIDEKGIKKTEQNDKIGVWNIKECIFPTMRPRLSGESGFDGKTYKQKGSLRAHITKNESGIEFTEIHIVMKVDDKIISDEIITIDSLTDGYDLDEKIPLEKGQTCTMTVIATDSIGFEHHYLVDHWVAGSNAQREIGMDKGSIYASDGKLLWQPERQ